MWSEVKRLEAMSLACSMNSYIIVLNTLSYWQQLIRNGIKNNVNIMQKRKLFTWCNVRKQVHGKYKHNQIKNKQKNGYIPQKKRHRHKRHKTAKWSDKNTVLRFFRKTGRDTDDVTESGRPFHARAATTEKMWSSIIERAVAGAICAPVAA